MTIQLAYMGLWAHQMGIPDSDKVKSEFGIPDDFQPVSVIAICAIGKFESLPEDYQEAEKSERGRKDLKYFVFS